MGARGGRVRAEGAEEVAKDDMDIVSALRAALAGKVGRHRFELWFGANTRLELEDGRLIIGAPSAFLQDWIRANFRADIESVCRETLGHCPELDFRADAACPQDAAAPSNSAVAECRTASLSIVHPDGPAPAGEPEPTERQERRPFADLESFVAGRSNRLARAAAESVVEQPGKMTPLVIHGPTGVGKTHLLEGIWSAVRARRRGAAVVYLSAEQFTNGFVHALRGSGLPSFRQKYRGVEFLLLDDLQFLRGKRCTLVELLYTVNTLLREGRQVVLAADRPLADLSDLGPELVSRLQGGMVCPIEPPDYETRLGILAQMARRFRLVLPGPVQHFIASRLTSHARELSGALCRLHAASQLAGRPVDLAMAQEALADMARHSARLVRLSDIEKAVCATFGLEAKSLQSQRKSKSVSQPRMLAMWLARKYTRAALSEIGYHFGRRSHSTVISAQKRVDDWLARGATLELADRTWDVDDAIRQVEHQLLAG